MRRVLGALAALAFVGLGSGAACSLIVANEFSGYKLVVDSGVCSLGSAASITLCGQCIARECGSAVNGHCGDGTFQSLAACAADPSPGGIGSCGEFVGDAAFGTEGSDFDIRACVSTNCSGPTDCTQCTDVDAAVNNSACGQCIMNSCGPLLSGLAGCCGDETVQDWIGDCTFAGHGFTCADLDNAVASNYPTGDGGAPTSVPDDAGNCEGTFANCVYNNCVMMTAQCH